MGTTELEYGLEDHVDHLTAWLDGLGVSAAVWACSEHLPSHDVPSGLS